MKLLQGHRCALFYYESVTSVKQYSQKDLASLCDENYRTPTAGLAILVPYRAPTILALESLTGLAQRVGKPVSGRMAVMFED